MTEKRATLIPPDKERCQAERREGTFMTFGGNPYKMIRCRKRPVWIATETSPGKDGRRGSMSLCGDCAEKMFEQLGGDYADVQPIRKKARRG